MAIDPSALRPLGWSDAFSTQLSLEQYESARAARVTGVERGHLYVDPGDCPLRVTLAGRFLQATRAPEERPTVGDWVLLEGDAPVVTARLERRSLIARRMAGGTARQATRATRRDAKGRHTTTSRALLRLPSGACIIDMPGMREVGLAPTGGAVGRHFRGIGELAQSCRFADCTHQGEPGCAVAAAAERGEVDPDAWAHYLRLAAEERRQVADHERRRRERVFGRLVRKAQSVKRGEGRR